MQALKLFGGVAAIAAFVAMVGVGKIGGGSEPEAEKPAFERTGFSSSKSNARFVAVEKSE